MVTNTSGRQEHVSGTAGVMARPTRLFPATLLLGVVLDRVLPLPFAIPRSGLVHSMRVVVASAFVLIGIALFSAGVRNFSRAGTPVPTNQPARVLVTSGIHGRTRNPIYLAFFLIYVGVGIFLRSPWILCLTIPLAAVIRAGVVAREEAYLERQFGEAYRAYKARVRRWV